MDWIPADKLIELLDFNELIPALKNGFAQQIHAPERIHFNWQEQNGTLLLMPAWQENKFAGVKLVTIFPNNPTAGIPSIQGMYILFDQVSGIPLVTMDAKMLTNLRTAATSGLASGYLSRIESKCMLMLGAGSLAPWLIRAHCHARPIEKVWIWSRNYQNADSLAKVLRTEGYNTSPVEAIHDKIQEADIVSAATYSTIPLIQGAVLRPGQHLDLVGAFMPQMRETDTTAILRGSVFVDNYESALEEAGDLVIPISENLFDKSAIKSSLFELCKGIKQGRSSEDEITVFKSVGHAMEDLVAAGLAYNKLINKL